MKAWAIGLFSKVAVVTLIFSTSLVFSQTTSPTPPWIHFGPPGGAIFQPNIPGLDSDDSYILYHYRSSGTGFWDGDPEYHLIGLTTGVEEYTVHVKTNGSETASSRGYSFYGHF